MTAIQTTNEVLVSANTPSLLPLFYICLVPVLYICLMPLLYIGLAPFLFKCTMSRDGNYEIVAVSFPFLSLCLSFRGKGRSNIPCIMVHNTRALEWVSEQCGAS